MRVTPASRTKLRRALDRRSANLRASIAPPPRSGWTRAVRESLGLTAAQLARRLKVATVTVLEMEKREASGRVTLETLERAARAMGCRFVYGIVPEGDSTLDAMVDAQALDAARRLAQRAAQSMTLEEQGVVSDETDAQVRDLAQTLKSKMPSSMWDE